MPLHARCEWYEESDSPMNTTYMEFSVLRIPEDATLEEAHEAIHRCQTLREEDLRKHIAALAQEAYARIERQRHVDHILQHLLFQCHNNLSTTTVHYDTVNGTGHVIVEGHSETDLGNADC
mgnify:CR=1 FL=1